MIANPEQRLSALWGLIDRQHNAQIASCLAPKCRVLDFGSGYGSLVNYLLEHGFDAEGLDIDEESIVWAKKLYPRVVTHQQTIESFAAEQAPYSWDAIVLRDSFHHLYNEHDPHSAFQAFKQLLKPDGKIIIFDPNPMWLLRIARRIINHVDPEASLQLTWTTLAQHGFKVQRVKYYEVMGLALSGGYVGRQLVPNVAVLNQLVAGLNAAASWLVNGLGLGRWLCWRYMICATKQ